MKTLKIFVSLNIIYPSSVADEVFGTSRLLVGVGAVSGALEGHGVLGELQDDGGGLGGLLGVAVVVHSTRLIAGTELSIEQMARVASVVERLHND